MDKNLSLKLVKVLHVSLDVSSLYSIKAGKRRYKSGTSCGVRADPGRSCQVEGGYGTQQNVPATGSCQTTKVQACIKFPFYVLLQPFSSSVYKLKTGSLSIFFLSLYF